MQPTLEELREQLAAAQRLVSEWRAVANKLAKQSPLKKLYRQCADDLESALSKGTVDA